MTPWYDSSGSVSSGNLPLSQLKLPLSTMAPPTCTAWPSRYFVVEWTTMSTPNSNGRQLIGVGKVLSTMIGTPCSWAICANSSRSVTTSEGFASVSANTQRVFSRKAARSSSAVEVGETKVKSMPISFIVL